MEYNLRNRLNLVLIIFFALLAEAYSWTCTKEIYGHTVSLSCPQAGDSPDKIFCCGSKKFRFCCSSQEFSKTINAISWIVGFFVSAIIVIVIIVVVSCFCCSCCLLAKRRQQRGHVIYGPVSGSSQPTTTIHTGTTPYPTQPTASGMPYPTQPAYPPMQYPQQYPPQAPAGYPAYPPPYPEQQQLQGQQPAFNPNYMGQR